MSRGARRAALATAFGVAVSLCGPVPVSAGAPAPVRQADAPASLPGTPVEPAPARAQHTVAQPVTASVPGPASYAYDAAGRLAGVVAADGAVARYSYDAAGNVTGVQRLGTPAVAVLSAVPVRVRPGDSMTVTGKGFSDTAASNTVTINGSAAAVQSATAERLAIEVPAGATSGDLQVTSPAGSASLPGITVINGDKPTITGFTPTTATPGTSVTVSVSNADPQIANNLVRLGDALAAVTAQGPGTLTITVPPGAGSGRLQFSTPAGSSTSTDVLVVPPSGVPLDSIESSGPITVDARTNVAVGAGKYALRYFDAADGDRFAAVLDGGTFSSCNAEAKLFDERNRQVAASSCVGVSGWLETTPTSGAGVRMLLLRNTGGSAGSIFATVLRVLSDLDAGVQPLNGTPKTVTIADRGRNGFTTFAGTAGQRVIVQSSASSPGFGCCNMRWKLTAPDGAQVGGLMYPNETIDTVTLPQTGTYKLTMDPSGALTGSTTFTAWDVPLDVDAGVQPLDGTAKTLTIDTPGYSAFSTFAGTAGQRVIIQSSASSAAFGCCNMRWSLTAPDGAQVGGLMYPNETIDTVTLPQTGAYRLTMNPSGVLTGSTTLRAWDVPPDLDTGSQPLDGTAKTLTIDTPGYSAFSTFAGTAGQRVIIQSSASSAAFGCCNMRWNLTAPDGVQVGGLMYPNETIETVTLPQTGTYKLTMNPSGALAGSTTLRAWDVPPDLDAGTQSLDGTPLTLTVGNPGRNAYSTFAGTTGQRVIIQSSASSAAFGCCNMRWNLTAPNGAQVGGLMYPNETIDTIVLPQTGTYRLTMNPSGVLTGSTTLRAWDVPPDLDTGSQPLDGTPKTLTIATPGYNAYSTFSGTTGQRVIIQSTASSAAFGCCNMRWNLTAPSGAQVGGLMYPNETIDTVTLPQTGTYKLTMNPSGALAGSTTLMAWDVPPDLDTGAQPLDGTPKTLTIATPGYSAYSTFAGTTGQRVVVQSSASSAAFGCCNMRWNLTAPNGAQVGGLMYPNETIETIVLPQTGTYRLTMNPSGVLTGSTTLRAWDVPPDLDTGSQPLDGTPKTLTIANPGQNAYSTFAGTTGQRVVVQSSASSAAFGCCNMRWFLTAPNGGQVGSQPYPNGTLDVTLPQTGTYRLTMNPLTSYVGSTTLTATLPGTQAAQVAVQAERHAALAHDAAPDPAPDAAETDSGPAVRPAPSGPAVTRSLKADTAPAPTGAAPRAPPAEAAPEGAAPTGATPEARPAAPVVPAARSNRPDPATGAAPLAATAQLAPAWTPDQGNLQGHDWLTRRGEPAPVEDLRAPAGVTAVSGHVLDLDGRPLAGVPVRIGDIRTSTDGQGRFLLQNVPTTATTVIVDGLAARTAPARYGTFRIRARVNAGATTPLDAAVWLPRLDMRHTKRIQSPTTTETVLQTPEIPGLEVRIPAGSVVRDLDGNVVRELGITAVPLDRSPYPLPRNGIVPTYFTVQPGGATIFPQGASVVYPNYTSLPAGSVVDFWNYDPADKGWYVYGHGRVSDDGRQVVPDENTRLWTLDGSMFNTPGNPKPDKPWWKDLFDWLSGDPVDLSTGMLTDSHTDLALDDTMPIGLTRAYYQGDGRTRQFGLNQSTEYDMFLASELQYQEVDLYLPGGGKVHYIRTSPGSSYSDAIFGATGSPGRFAGSTITQISGDWVLQLRDGMKYFFPWYSRVRAIQDRNGNQITFTRIGGSNGEVSRITSPNGRWIAFEYDASNRVIRATDNIGRAVSYTYDAAGRLATVTDVAGRTRTYRYDTANRITRITDARGVAYLDVTYDGNGRVATQTVPGGGTYGFAYTVDAAGLVTETRVTQPNGSVRRVVFDPATRMAVSDTAAHGTSLARTTTLVRGPNNRVDAVVDASGRRTDYGYDQSDRLTAVTELAGTADQVVVAQATYGPFDRPLTTTDTAGKVTSYGYDPRGNLTAVTDPLGRTTSMTWTSAGQIASVTTAADQTTRFSYEAGGLVAVRDPLGRVSRRFVDAAGRTVSATDAIGATTLVTYDAQNQPTRIVDPLGGETTFGYDANGNLTSFTDQRGKVTTWTYDDADRVAARTEPLARTTTTTYDAAGRLIDTTAPSGLRTTAAYDALDRVTGVRYGVSGDDAQSEVTYGYDAFDRLASLTDTAGGTTSFGYDAFDRVTSTTGPNGVVTYGYDDAGRQSSTGLPGQPLTAYAYDDAGQLTGVSRGADSTSLGYDAAGRLTSLTLPGGWTQSFGYDTAGQLTGIGYRQGGTDRGSLGYAYDAAGQRTAVTGTLANVVLPEARADLAYDDANRLVSVAGVPLTYDADGNLLSDGTTAYTWDARGQLSGTSQAGVNASYGYDAAGNRSTRTVNGTTTRFLLDGANVAAELDGAGAVTATLLSGGVDQWFSRSAAGVTDTVLTDALGSPVALGRADGTFGANHAYDPFGQPATTGDRRGSDLSFTGRQDDGTGLLHYRARYYSPSLQRFVSEDPIGLAGGTNLYGYAANSPTNFTDPTGNNPVAGCLIGAAIGGGLDYLGQRLSGRKVDWGLGGVGGAAAAGCIGGALGGMGPKFPKIKPGSSGGPTAGKPFPKNVRDGALKENPDTCVYCRMKTDKPQVDHAIPRARGGDATPPNAQTTCPHCNASKRDRDFPVNPPPGYRGPWPPPWWPR